MTRGEYEAVVARWRLVPDRGAVEEMTVRPEGHPAFQSAKLTRVCGLNDVGIAGALLAREALEVRGYLTGTVHGDQIYLEVMVTRPLDEQEATS